MMSNYLMLLKEGLTCIYLVFLLCNCVNFIYGNVVNVPADVTSTVNILPRSLSETETIPSTLKCHLSH